MVLHVNESIGKQLEELNRFNTVGYVETESPEYAKLLMTIVKDMKADGGKCVVGVEEGNIVYYPSNFSTDELDTIMYSLDIAMEQRTVCNRTWEANGPYDTKTKDRAYTHKLKPENVEPLKILLENAYERGSEEWQAYVELEKTLKSPNVKCPPLTQPDEPSWKAHPLLTTEQSERVNLFKALQEDKFEVKVGDCFVVRNDICYEYDDGPKDTMGKGGLLVVTEINGPNNSATVTYRDPYGHPDEMQHGEELIDGGQAGVPLDKFNRAMVYKLDDKTQWTDRILGNPIGPIGDGVKVDDLFQVNGLWDDTTIKLFAYHRDSGAYSHVATPLTSGYLKIVGEKEGKLLVQTFSDPEQIIFEKPEGAGIYGMMPRELLKEGAFTRVTLSSDQE